MFAIALGSLVMSAMMTFLIGYAVIADRDSFLRTKFGIVLLVTGAVSFVPLPPQLPSIDAALEPIAGQLGSLASTFAWPGSLDKGLYLAAWIVSSLAALLVGMRIWNVRKPGWRPGSGSSAYDTSATGRARGLIPLADSLDEALQTISRTGVDSRGVTNLAEELRAVGRRFSASLPAESGAVYNLVVSALPTGGLAPAVTRYLLEGAGRAGQTGGEVPR